MRYYKPFERPNNDEFIQECDNPLVEQFKEIPPFTQDPVTGEILNDTPYPKLVKVESMNIQEYIDSFDDKDIYSMIKNNQTLTSYFRESNIDESDSILSLCKNVKIAISTHSRSHQRNLFCIFPAIKFYVRIV